MQKTVSNPWQKDGVSILPSDLSELMPLVGQKVLFQRLNKFRQEILDPAGRKLTGFFTIFGAWGVGKSRVGHQLCLEALSEEVEWVVDGAPGRVLQPSLADGILPIFLRYIQITKGRHGERLEQDNWIASAIVEALGRMAQPHSESESGILIKNQDRILDLARKALRPKGWDKQLPALKNALAQADPITAARSALTILKENMSIRHLWIVIDEIEDITDVQHDGLRSLERRPIDQGLLTMIPRVIKDEETRQVFPEVSFLLLCSNAVGDQMRKVRAIERRTGWEEITTNTFGDVEAFFAYLMAHHPALADAIARYPAGLKEAAFFAANRNFGWFNVIMHHAHQNCGGPEISTPELLRQFALQTTKGEKGSVFDIEAVNEFHIPRDADYERIVRFMFGLFPQPYGTAEKLSEAEARRLLNKMDAGTGTPLFAEVVEITPPRKHLIMSHLVGCGFRNTGGSELMMPGETHFDLQVVLDSLEAYSIHLPADRREHLLICEKESDFEDQIKGLTPYAEQASQFARQLHALLADAPYRVTGADGHPRRYVGPSFAFLMRFNRLNRMRRAEEGYLRDGTKNSSLEEEWRKIQGNRKDRIERLLKGLANAWDIEEAPLAPLPLEKIILPAITFTSNRRPLNLGHQQQVALLYASDASEADLEKDLVQLAKQPAAPVIVLLEEQEQRLEDLRRRIDRNVPGIAPFVVLHNMTRVVADHLGRLGLMGSVFTRSDLRTSHFHAAIGVAREHLGRTLESWLANTIEARGLLMRPLFFGTAVKDEQLAAFAKGYAGLLSGYTYTDVCTVAGGILVDARERDDFKKMLDRHTDPGPKYQDEPRLPLVRDIAGDKVAAIPRALVEIVRWCGAVPMAPADLENKFLFDLGSQVRARDVVRQITGVLVHLGLLESQDGKVSQTSVHRLQTWLNSAWDWLDGDFDKTAQAIGRIHRQAGDELAKKWSKEARHRLKKAENELANLSMKFTGQAWDDLNEPVMGDQLLFEKAFSDALKAVTAIRKAVAWVYDPGAISAFRYSPEGLKSLEEAGGSEHYPLWRRLLSFKGFYTEMERRRRELIKQMDAVLADVDRRVRVLSSGEKAFPVQVLTLPLNVYRQELSFDPDQPERTISAGGTTIGVHSTGFKLASGRFGEVLERLDFIAAELERPGRLVARFMQTLAGWEGLRETVRGCAAGIEGLEAFFGDAPAAVQAEYDVAATRSLYLNLNDAVEAGGIREGTDAREVAGTPVFDLIDGLEEDLRKIEDQPRLLEAKIEETRNGVLPALHETYSQKYQERTRAIARIRKVSGRDPLMWPEALGATYQKTVDAFDALVREIDKEGRNFFADGGETTFEVFVGLNRLEAEKGTVDWNVPEHQRHVPTLMAKGLLVMRLA